MVSLREIDQSNFNDCIALERKTHRFVGDATYVLAEAYTVRHHSTAYGIYNDDTIVGMVVLRDNPDNKDYSFTDLFIADNFQNNGYGKETIEQIITKFRTERKSNIIELYVHESNENAINIYMKYGFMEDFRATWDNNFLHMTLHI